MDCQKQRSTTQDNDCLITSKAERLSAERNCSVNKISKVVLVVMLVVTAVVVNFTMFVMQPTCRKMSDNNITEARCDWPENEINRRRREFCDKFEGYGNLCSCENQTNLTFNPSPIAGNRMTNIPVAIIAGDRPHYLYRMLLSLLSTPGVNPATIAVFIDAFSEGPMEVCRLLGVAFYQDTPISIRRELAMAGVVPKSRINNRITQHYKSSLSATFAFYPDAKYAIILEEDLLLAVDFFSYFSQTIDLMEKDESIYCISAWNDQVVIQPSTGYNHSCRDPSLLYRTEHMPGLGWLLKRSLYKTELEPNWPKPEQRLSSWDWWMREPQIRRDRECIIPDVSRTYHIGAVGFNVNPKWQEKYLAKHRLNTKPNVQLNGLNDMTKVEYEELMKSILSSARPILFKNTSTGCDDSFMSQLPNDGQSYVLYIRMTNGTDKSSWKPLFKCLRIWDFDDRGKHKNSWRMFFNDHPLIVVGAPASPYSNFMPSDYIPLTLNLSVMKQKSSNINNGGKTQTALRKSTPKRRQQELNIMNRQKNKKEEDE